jgi:hypothetical protein
MNSNNSFIKQYSNKQVITTTTALSSIPAINFNNKNNSFAKHPKSKSI